MHCIPLTSVPLPYCNVPVTPKLSASETLTARHITASLRPCEPWYNHQAVQLPVSWRLGHFLGSSLDDRQIVAETISRREISTSNAIQAARQQRRHQNMIVVNCRCSPISLRELPNLHPGGSTILGNFPNQSRTFHSVKPHVAPPLAVLSQLRNHLAYLTAPSRAWQRLPEGSE
jgi:hypothetical protein